MARIFLEWVFYFELMFIGGCLRDLTRDMKIRIKIPKRKGPPG